MKNLNAEQVKKALECCRHSDSDEDYCADCPYRTVKYCAAKISENALALINSQEQRIKELTEENERLSLEYAGFEGAMRQISEGLKHENVELKKERHRLQKALNQSEDYRALERANTVKKMQERFNEKVAKLLISPSIQYQANAFIDQIAKEMLEVRQNDR